MYLISCRGQPSGGGPSDYRSNVELTSLAVIHEMKIKNYKNLKIKIYPAIVLPVTIADLLAGICNQEIPSTNRSDKQLGRDVRY
jgi:hypothetical protein